MESVEFIKEENPEVYLAEQYVLYTSRSMFLTGRAGTGKTTFLKSIRERAIKRMAVAAPTGIAAINAAGVTLHSLFQLPFGSYIPEGVPLPDEGAFFNKNYLLRNSKIGADKRRLLQELELLVIDEVSMLRCDLLDAIDALLKHIRRNPQPFGGLQLLFIGDLQQLPPVVQDYEWSILSQHYKTPFFFSSHAFQEMQPVYIELKKIYRQSEVTFINLLENVRKNQISAADLELLNSRLNATSADKEGQITLTTHNSKAETMNQKKLESLKSGSFEYKGMLHGDFNEKNLPTEERLILKKGAQVMFIKNDPSGDKRYFNGCMGIIKDLGETFIKVDVEGIADTIKVEKEVWSNIRYVHKEESNKVEEEETGSFSQYPLKLAWAITIHKSQGLTFDQLRIDAADAFAAGQVYVALSRCRTLEGITLTTPLSRQAIQTDGRLNNELLTERDNEEHFSELTEAKKIFAREQLAQAFRFHSVTDSLRNFEEFLVDRNFDSKEVTNVVLKMIRERLKELEETGYKFTYQLESHFQSGKNEDEWLQERIGKGIAYFSKQLHNEVVDPLDKLYKQLSDSKGTKGVLKKLYPLKESFWQRLQRIQSIEFSSFDFSAFHQKIDRTVTEKPEEEEKPKRKAMPKGTSVLETLRLQEEGKTVSEIATERGMAVSTIESHFIDLIAAASIEIEDLVSEKDLKIINTAFDKFGTEGLTSVREKLGNSYSFGQLRMVKAYRNREL